MVHCSENNAMYPIRYTTPSTLTAYGYSGQEGGDGQYTGQMTTVDGYSPFHVNFSDPNIQQMAQSASWAGVYAARSGHPSSHGSTMMEEWGSQAPNPAYCTSTESSPSPDNYGYGIQAYHRSTMSPNVAGIDYSTGQVTSSPAPTGHGVGISVISHHSTSVPGERSCQTSPTGSRPLRPPYDWMKRQSYQSIPNAGKTRTKDKYRVVYSDHQRLELEKEFHYNRYITIRRKAELAQSLSLSERQVKIWFQNRRAKERKQKKKEQKGGDVKIIPEVTDHPQVQAHMHAHAHSGLPAQQTQAQVHAQPQLQSLIPTQELSQSQTPHLAHTQTHAQAHEQTTARQPEAIHQEEIPSPSPLQNLQS